VEEIFSTRCVQRYYNHDQLSVAINLQNKIFAPLEIFQGAHRSAICPRLSNFLYVYDYTTKLCRQKTEVIQNHENEPIRSIGQGEARHRKYKRLKLGGDQAYDRSSD
jgi:hypothetical protein